MATALEQNTVLTPDDLERLSSDHRYELVAGALVEKTMGGMSSLTAMAIGSVIRQFAKKNRLGFVFGPDCGYKIFGEKENRVRFPDVSFIRSGRLPNDEAPAGHVTIAPDLAVEVISPNDTAEQVESRIWDFRSVGVPLVWILYPTHRRVWVVKPTGEAAQLAEKDVLSGEPVLPGFSLTVGELFAEI